jgi:hypothetical protein
VEKLRIWLQWHFSPVSMGWLYWLVLWETYGDILLHWEQFQPGARLGGTDFHRSQQSTTSSQQQSTSGRPRETFYQEAYVDIIAVTSGGLSSLFLVLDQFLFVTPKQSTVMFQIFLCAATISSILENQPLLLSEIILNFCCSDISQLDLDESLERPTSIAPWQQGKFLASLSHGSPCLLSP